MEKRITLAHIHAAGLCSTGGVSKLKALGFTRAEIRDALKNGIPLEQAKSYHDAMVDKVIEIAEKEWDTTNG